MDKSPHGLVVLALVMSSVMGCGSAEQTRLPPRDLKKTAAPASAPSARQAAPSARQSSIDARSSRDSGRGEAVLARIPASGTRRNPEAEAQEPAESSRLLRGLGNALSRALSKTLSEEGNSGIEEADLPPAEDDPFPQGEPDFE